MSVSITFTGDIYNTNGIKFSGTEVSYQVYFKQVNGSSSPSTWSNVRFSGFGQYNCNLADGDLLGTDGNAGNNDIVVIIFWHPGIDRNANCSTLIEWSAFEVVLGIGPGMVSSAVYVNTVSVSTNINPNLSWVFPVQIAPHYVDTLYDVNNNSDDEHSFTISGTTMHHWYLRYVQIINNVNQVNNSDYYWGDASSDLNLPGAANGTHQWVSAGIYDVDLIIEDECAGTASGTKQIKIYWHPPTADITMIPAVPDPNELVSFQWTGTDVDSTITSIDWIIYDTGTDTTTSGQVSGATVPHSAGLGTDWCGTLASGGAFTNPGIHNVAIVINWNDGFSDKILNYNENFNQGLFSGPTVSFIQVPTEATVSSGVKFTNTSTNTSRVGLGLPDCDRYDWTFTDDGVSTDYLDKPYGYELEVVPNSVNCQVRLCANWSDGWDTKQTCKIENVVFGTKVTITEVECYYNLNVIGTSTGGTITGYSWTIASGINETGPWTEVWKTPIGIYQNDKKVCFTSIGWYKATGYVYGAGSPTSGYETLYVDEVCVTVSGVVGLIYLPVCDPDFTAHEEGALHVSVGVVPEAEPSMRTETELKPRIGGSDELIPGLKAFPTPNNL